MIKIRSAKLKDVEQINKLHSQLREFESNFDSLQMLDEKTKKFSLRWFKKNIKNKNVKIIVAEENKEIAGYALALIRHLKTSGPYLFDKKIGIIQDLFISKNYRKRGIGKILVREIIRWFKAKKIGTAELYAYSENKNAVKFWKKAGFRELFKDLSKKI